MPKTMTCAICDKPTRTPCLGEWDGKRVAVCASCFTYETGETTPVPFSPKPMLCGCATYYEPSPQGSVGLLRRVIIVSPACRFDAKNLGKEDKPDQIRYEAFTNGR